MIWSTLQLWMLQCYKHWSIHCYSVNLQTLKQKCSHFDEIFVTDCTESCQNDNFRCSQWRKFHQNDDIYVSVNVTFNFVCIWFHILLYTAPFEYVIYWRVCDTYAGIHAPYMAINGENQHNLYSPVKHKGPALCITECWYHTGLDNC